MKGYVYIITNNIDGKQYVGSRMAYKGENIYNDSYMGSSKYLDIDISTYGIENFTKEILQDNYIDINEMLKRESFYMHEYKTFEPNGYNRYDPIKRNGFYSGMKGKKHSDETKKRISEKGKISQIGHFVSRETRIKIGKGNSKSLKGIKFDEYRKIKMRGWHHSEEAKQKIGLSSKNSERYTKERSLKIWETRRKNGKGKISDEHKRKISKFWEEKRLAKINL
ncbi:MAG: NUMOD3 domain-containing DNA-binding protein [Candidatus Nanoarchaeia archaeon]|nr:NUMOD3 domain-containing DNA-binding protein [Candidatus Nanoarchaeia archaeon]